MTVQKIKSGRIASIDANTYIGEIGTIFYNQALGDLRLSDGVTPGGQAIIVATSGSGSSTYSNANVASYLPSYNGNFVANYINVTSTVTATGANTGALIVAGGAGFGGNVWTLGKLAIGDSLNNANIARVLSTSATSGNAAYRAINLIDTGGVVKIARLGNNPSIELQQWDSAITAISSYWEMVSYNGGIFQIRDRVTGTSKAFLNIFQGNGNVVLISSTASTSTTTGALVVPYGGIGVGGSVNAGSFIANNTPSNSTLIQAQQGVVGNGYAVTLNPASTGPNLLIGTVSNPSGYMTIGHAIQNSIDSNTYNFNLNFTGGFGASAAVFNASTGNFTLASTQNATGLNSGALNISQGGASIYQDLWVGGNIYANALNTVTTSILSIQDPLLYLNSNAPYPYNYDLGFYGHFVGGPANVYAHTGFVRNHNDNTWYLFSNIPEPSGNTINLLSANIVYDTLKLGSINVANATASTSTTTGALVVAGGAGFGGSLNVGGGLTVNGVNTALNNTTINGSGTNLLLQSQNFTFSPWTLNGTATVASTAATTDPLGTSTAYILSNAIDMSLSGNNLYQGYAFGVIPINTTYTFSLYVKSAGATTGNIGIRDGNSGVYPIQSFAPTSTWQRVSVTITSSSGTYYGSGIYIGGIDAPLYIWGPQINLGSSASTYIPTTTTRIQGYPTLSFAGAGSVQQDNLNNLLVSPNAGGNIILNSGNTYTTGSLTIASNATVNGGILTLTNVVGSNTAAVITTTVTTGNTSLALKSQGNIDLSAGNVMLSNGTGVTAITPLSRQGSVSNTGVTVTFSPPTVPGGVTATANIVSGASAVTIVSGGTGYNIGDLITLSGGNVVSGFSAAVVQVTGNSGGTVTSVTSPTGGSPSTQGYYWTVPTGTITTTSNGAGVGATFTANWYWTSSYAITNAGSGYLEPPTLTFNATTGGATSAWATIGSATKVQSLGATMSLSTASGSTGFQIYDAGGTNGAAAAYWRAAANFGSTNALLLSTAIGQISSSGANQLGFYTNTVGQEQLRVAHTASAVNYVQATGAATGSGVVLSAQGTDTNIDLVLTTKGVGNVNLSGPLIINSTLDYGYTQPPGTMSFYSKGGGYIAKSIAVGGQFITSITNNPSFLINTPGLGWGAIGNWYPTGTASQTWALGYNNNGGSNWSGQVLVWNSNNVATITAPSVLTTGGQYWNGGTGNIQANGSISVAGATTSQTVYLAGGNNLAPYSQTFSAWTKVALTLTNNANTAPDGSYTASSIVEDNTTGAHEVFYNNVNALATVYTYSIYAKANTRNWLKVSFDNGSLKGVFFDVTNGVVGTADAGYTGTIVSVGNGWYRCITTTTAVGGTYYPDVNLASANGTASYTGNGTSGLYIWGPQLELGSIASPYTATTTTAIVTPNNLYMPSGNIVGSPTVTGNLFVGNVSSAVAPWTTGANVIVSTGITNGATPTAIVIQSNDVNLHNTGYGGSLDFYAGPEQVASLKGMNSSNYSGSGQFSLWVNNGGNASTMTEVYRNVTAGATYAQGYHAWYNAGLTVPEVMRLSAPGWLGIGTSAPAATLHVNGNAIIATTLTIGNTVISGNSSFYGNSTVFIGNNVSIAGNATSQSINLAGGNNLFTYSANLLLWGTTNISVAGVYSDPFGGNTAVQLTDVVTTSAHDIYQIPVLTPGNYTFSVYAKASTANYLFLFYSGTNQGVYYNIANGTVYGYYQYQQNGNNPYSIVSAGNGWYRCTMTCSALAGSGNYWGIYTAESGGNYSTGTGLAILVAAPQLEPGIIASSYTPTTASAITTYNNLYISQGNLTVNNTLQARTGGNVDITANALVLGSGTTSITSITQTATGNLYTSAPTVTISAPTSQIGGTTATATANIGVVFVANIYSAGLYYTPGQVLTMVGNSSTFANATFTVAAVGNTSGGLGNVTGLTITTSGSYAIANANPATFTVASGAGTGLLVNVYYGVNQPTITNAGTGYVEQPTVTISGGGGSGAAAYATVGAPTNITGIGANLSINLPQGEVIKIVTSPVIQGVLNGNLGGNLGIGQYANTALTATALTGNAIAAGGIGIVGNVYGTSRFGYTWTGNGSSAAYTVFNPAMGSIDTYFG